MSKTFYQTLSVILLILSLFLGYAVIYPDFRNKLSFLPSSKSGADSLTSTLTEDEILRKINENYLREYPDAQTLADFKNKGIVESLGDPYSEYITAKEEKDFQANLNQRYKGIGIKLDKTEAGFIVAEVLLNSPALESGVKAGDGIIKVDDVLVTNQTTTSQLISKIRGEENTAVKIQFIRAGQALDISINRREIKSDLFKVDYKNDLAIIKLYSFGEGLDQRMQEISAQIKAKPEVKKIVLDVRSNTGGLLNEAIDVVSYFVPTNTLVLQEKSKASSKTDVRNLYSTDKKNSLGNYPVFVLTDRFSASASEILAGALRDVRGAKIIGETTFGKGVVQQIFKLKNGDFVKLTIAEWLTPKGLTIDKTGLEPDIKIDPKKDILEYIQ
jgi:carboxyl-terminal processing protease